MGQETAHTLLAGSRLDEAPIDLDLVRALAGFPQIMLELHLQPGVARAAKYLFGADRHVGRNACMAVQEIGEALAGHPQCLGRRGHRKAERLQALLADDLTEMRRLCISILLKLLSAAVQ